jgi:hypothetical protein
MIRRFTHYFAAIALAAALCFAASASAQDYKAATSAAPVPPEISSAIRGLLSPTSTSVAGPGGSPYCEIWMRTSIPAAAQPSSALGVNYGTLVDGELVGAIRFDVAVKDFRNQPVKPGTYLMRYGLQPVDGNHQGVSDYRDFLLLTPPDQDTSPDNLAENPMYVLSRKTTTTGHPSVWSLVPTDDAPASLPGTKQNTDENFSAVYFQAAVGTSPTKIGLVIFGHAATP